jgi:hypothetical protein
MDFDINELKKVQNEKKENRKKVFIIVLEKCIKRIKYINKNSNSTSCCYVIPKLIVGQPLFNIDKCSGFLLEELNTLGFITNFIKPDRINISWDFTESEPQKGKTDPKKGKKIDNKESDFNILDGLNFNK